MSIIHLDIGIVHDKGLRSSIRTGDSVQYTVIRRLSPEKAVIKFLGRNVVAAISTDQPDRGRAVIRSVGERIELVLKPIKRPPAPDVVRSVPPEQSLLLAHGVKADARNIDYLATVMKHIGVRLTDSDKAFVLSLIGKGIYLSPERLERIVDRRTPLRIRDALREGKDDDLFSLFSRVSVIELGERFPEALSEYVCANGQFLLWVFMLGTGDRDAREQTEMLAMNSGSDLLLPLFIKADDAIHFVEMRYRGRGTKHDAITFTVMDEARPRVAITFVRGRGRYDIALAFHDEELYARYVTCRDALTRSLAACFGGKYEFSVSAVRPDDDSSAS